MDYFNDKLNELTVQLPKWVSKNNSSYAAYMETEKQISLRFDHIKKSSRAKDFRIIKSYQISRSEIAKNIGITRVTLSATASYAPAFNEYLDLANSKLKLAKDEKLSKCVKSRSRGPIARSKDELVKETVSHQAQISKLEDTNALEQVNIAFSLLHPEIRKLLRIPAAKKPGTNILPFTPD